MAQFESDFRKEHAEEDRDFARASERWNRLSNTLDSISNVAYAACAVAGTVVTGGYGGNFVAGGGKLPAKYTGQGQGKPMGYGK